MNSLDCTGDAIDTAVKIEDVGTDIEKHNKNESLDYEQKPLQKQEYFNCNIGNVKELSSGNVKQIGQR